MNIDLTGRMYKVDTNVYIGYTPIPVKEQRGKLYVNYKRRQINLKDIPVLPQPEKDPVFDYIFEGGFSKYPCIAMDYWIYRWRLGNRISTKDYVLKFKKS